MLERQNMQPEEARRLPFGTARIFESFRPLALAVLTACADPADVDLHANDVTVVDTTPGCDTSAQEVLVRSWGFAAQDRERALGAAEGGHDTCLATVPLLAPLDAEERDQVNGLCYQQYDNDFQVCSIAYDRSIRACDDTFQEDGDTTDYQNCTWEADQASGMCRAPLYDLVDVCTADGILAEEAARTTAYTAQCDSRFQTAWNTAIETFVSDVERTVAHCDAEPLTSEAGEDGLLRYKPATYRDADRDGVNDGEEFRRGTDPCSDLCTPVLPEEDTDAE